MRQVSPSFHDHFSGVANRYANFRPHYPAALFDYLTTLVPKNSAVWDCACGNGQATLDLAARFDEVIATDAKRMRGERPFVFSNLKTGQGLPEIIAFIIDKGMLPGR